MDLKYSRLGWEFFPSNAKMFHRGLPSSHNPCLWHRGPSVLIFGDGERGDSADSSSSPERKVLWIPVRMTHP